VTELAGDQVGLLLSSLLLGMVTMITWALVTKPLGVRGIITKEEGEGDGRTPDPPTVCLRFLPLEGGLTLHRGEASRLPSAEDKRGD
jgi:hypothetical protein